MARPSIDGLDGALPGVGRDSDLIVRLVIILIATRCGPPT